MIEKFKNDREEKKDQQIAQKTANAAVQFKKINNAQKIVENRLR